jgi:hypothetical protein
MEEGYWRKLIRMSDLMLLPGLFTLRKRERENKDQEC